jgi:hypothetical protein
MEPVKMFQDLSEHLIPGGSRMRAGLVGLALLSFVVPSQAQARVLAYVPIWIDVKSFSETIDYLNPAAEHPATK